MPSLLFDARLVLEKPTGIGQYITSLLVELSRQVPDWQIHILRRSQPWPGYNLSTWQASNIIHHVTRERHMSLRQHWMLPRLAQKLGVDLLHYPHFDAPVLYQPVPVIVTLHDAKYLVRPDFFTNLNQIKRQYMRFSFAQSLHRAAGVITISQATANDMRTLFGIQPHRMTVIYEAPDPQFRPSSPADDRVFRERYKIQRPFLLTVGERRPHKNHLGLLQAYAHSHSRYTHDLVIIGQPYLDYTAPETFVQDNGLTQQVHFLSNVTFPDLIAAYTAADLFVLVSFYEGFGLPILEAMACNTPVIAANTTAAGEIVGEGGIAIDPDNIDGIRQTIDDLLCSPERRQTLVEKGHMWQQQFSWQRTAAETLELYRQVLEYVL